MSADQNEPIAYARINSIVKFTEQIKPSSIFARFKLFNPFSPSQLSTTNFSLDNAYKIWHLVIRKWDLIKQSKLLKIKSKVLANLFNDKYGLKLGEFNNTAGTERVKAKRFVWNLFSFATILWYIYSVTLNLVLFGNIRK